MGRTARFTRGSRWDDLQVIGEALEFSLALPLRERSA